MGLLKLCCLSFMRAFVLIVCFCLTFRSFSQERKMASDTIPPRMEEQVLPDTLNKVRFGLFGEVLIENEPFPDERDFSERIGFGVEYRHFILGIYRTVYLGQFQKTLIFPNDFELNYAHGGVFLGHRLFRQDLLDGDLRVSYGRGDLVWERADSGPGFIRDEVTAIKADLVISFVPIRFAKLFGVLGYRAFYHLDMPQVNEKDFTGLTVGMGIKLGYFSHR